MKIQKRALSLVLALSMVVTAFSGTAAFAEGTGEESTKDSQSTLIKGDELSWDNNVLKTSFTWSSETGIGSENASELSSTGYTYYSDGAYLRFQIKDSNEDVLKFTDVFGPSDEDNDTKGAMTLQTIKEGVTDPPVNDMDGSNREKADWTADGGSQSKTNLPNPDGSNYIFYGLIQNKTDRTKTVGFNPGDERTVNMTLTPKSDLESGTYILTVEALQQGKDEAQSEIVYTFNTEDASSSETVYVGGTGDNHFETLSDALEQVKEGGTVCLDSNITVATTVDVTKPVTIDGQNHTITAADDIKASERSGKNHVLDLFQTKDVTLQNLTINGSNKARGGIIAYQTQDVNLKDVSISNCTIGIIVDNEASVTVDGKLTLNNNAWGGINVDPKEGDQSIIKLTVKDDAKIDFKSSTGKTTPPIWVDFPNKPETDDAALTAAEKFVQLPQGWESVYYPDKDNGQVWFSITADEPTDKTITSFDEVDPIEAPYGTEKAKLSLPETLTGHYQDGDTAKDVTVPVTWTCETYDGNTAGEYPFVPTIDLPEGYQLGEDVTAPEVTVSVYPEGIKPVTGILLPTRSLYVGALGATRQWKATFKPSDATNKKVTWESSDPTVATIDQNGLMTYVAYGQTTITVTTEDGGYTASCEVTVQSQEDYDKEVEDAQKSVEALPKASDADVNDSDTADAIKDAVSNVQHYGEDVTKKLDAAAVENLESLLAKLTDGVVTKTVSVDSESIKDSGKKITEQPSVSGLFLASGITGDEREETPVELEMKQIVPTAENALLAFELNLSVDGEETHDLAIPVTVTFKLPDSFTYNSSRTYQIQHVNEEEDINELLNLTFNGRYASFTTSSFSTFTLVSTPKNSGSDPDSNHHHSSSGSGSTPSATPSTPSFISDTTMDFSVNGAYQFKITSTNGAAPSLVAGTAGVFETQLVSTSGSDYYFQLTAIGKPGEQTGIYVNGVKLLVATVGTAASSVKSDTTKPIRVSKGKTYLFKLTADEKPAFVSGNSQVFQTKFVKQSGKDYFYQVTAVGKAGQSAGFYINSDKTPVTVATVA